MSNVRRIIVGGATATDEPGVVKTLQRAQEVLRASWGRERPLGAGVMVVEAMLAEIEETFLTRFLTFTASGGRRLVIEAGQGKFLRFVDMRPEDICTDQRAELAEASGNLGPSHAEAAKTCMVAFAYEATSVTVAAEALPMGSSPTKGGIPVEALALDVPGE